jgi:CBS domain-containing protein
MDGEPETPKQEFAISAVGPATSLAVAGAAFALLPTMPDGLLEYVVRLLAGANLIVGILNLVPGMPLDGGRVLRAGVWKATGDPHRATVAAGWVGRAVAVVVLFSPWLLELAGIPIGITDYIIALVFGWFMWSAATSAIMSARIRSKLPALRARALARRTLAVPEGLPLAEAIRQARGIEAGSIVTQDAEGRPVGVVNEAAVLATPEERRSWMAVRDVTRTLEPGLTLPADIAGEQLIRAMQAAPATEYLLVEPDGSLYGVLCTSDVDAAFSAKR